MTQDVARAAGTPVDPTERVELLMRDLRTRREGLSSREAERRLIAAGPNEMRRHAQFEKMTVIIPLDVHGIIVTALALASTPDPLRRNFTHLQARAHRGELGLNIYCIHAI